MSSAALNLICVDNVADPRLADYTDLKDVQLRSAREPAQGLYMAESSQVIRRALAAGHQPRSLLLAPRWLESLRPEFASGAISTQTPVFLAEEPVLTAITGFHLHRGALAAMHRPDLPALESVIDGARRVAVLADLVDHTNVGAAFRSAAALGVEAVLVTPSCADPLYRRSVRVSMGAVFQVPWTRITVWPGDLEILRTQGFTVAALALAKTAISLDELAARCPQRLALVLGSEGPGLDHRTLAACDLMVRIPMTGGVDSLNVAAASAVAFWATRTVGEK